MTILDIIVKDKKKLVERKKQQFPVAGLMENFEIAMNQPSRSFYNAVSAPGRVNIIGELKHASPTAGILRENFDVRELAAAMVSGGVAAISVLTEDKYFFGGLSYLKTVSETTEVPLLCKDFIVDEYQIYEARIYNASAVLLIASVLTTEQMEKFLSICREAGLDAVVEIHNEEEFKKIPLEKTSIIGINNRDLKKFSIDIDTTLKLRKLIPGDKIIISESGIKTKEQLFRLKEAGVHAALIGETLMRSKDITKTLKELTL